MKHSLQTTLWVLLEALSCACAWARPLASVGNSEFFDARAAMPAGDAIYTAHAVAGSAGLDGFEAPSLSIPALASTSDAIAPNSMVEMHWLTAQNAPAVNFESRPATACCVRITVGWAKPVDRGIESTGLIKAPAPNPEATPFMMFTLGGVALFTFRQFRRKISANA